MAKNTSILLGDYFDNFIKPTSELAFKENLSAGFYRKFDRYPTFIDVNISGGTHKI